MSPVIQLCDSDRSLELFSETTLLTAVDSYKASHFAQYPPDATRVSSYIEARGGPFKSVRFFGLQAILKRFFLHEFRVEEVVEAKELFEAHGLPFNFDGWMRIADGHKGKLPLAIEAAPEGTDIPTGNVLVQVVNTDPALPWLTSWAETALMQVWYPTTVCTLSAEIRAVLMDQLERSCEKPEEAISFRLHDFGCRGVSSMESAGIGGAAHLVNFLGTDTVPALIAARAYYGEPMAGFSIPAMEHSTVTSWGREGEDNAFRSMIRKFGGPGKMLAIVVDSYNMEHAVKYGLGVELYREIKGSGGKVVVRPDSGDPRVMVPRVLRWLDEAFGATNNHKGFRVLHPCVGVIQGDGMSLESIRETGEAVLAAGYSAENVAYGLGGGLLQKIDRDTMSFAMKASAIEIDGIWHDVYKSPMTDERKASKKGRLALVETVSADGADEHLETVRLADLGDRQNQLVPVYRDGVLVEEPFTTIRQRARFYDRKRGE